MTSTVVSIRAVAAGGPHAARGGAFDPASCWRSEPNGVVASGSDIIDHTGGLEQYFIPLLTHT
jgi:hypothetical protein